MPRTFWPKARHTVRLISFSAGLSSTGNLQQHQTRSKSVNPFAYTAGLSTWVEQHMETAAAPQTCGNSVKPFDFYFLPQLLCMLCTVNI
jgi:hypothetical protein